MAIEIFVPEDLSTTAEETNQEMKVKATVEAVDMVNGDGQPESETSGGPGGDVSPSLVDDEADAEWEDAEGAEESGLGEFGDDGEEPTSESSVTITEAERKKAELQHAIDLQNAKEEHNQFAINRSNLEEELKDAKADEKASLKRLKNLIRRGPAYPVKPSVAKQTVQDAAGSAIEVDDPAADQSWRLVPTSAIIEGIKGMGSKKAEAIMDLAPTLGDLEELRAEASKEHMAFSQVLPKGVGGALADEIEERILSEVAKYCAE